MIDCLAEIRFLLWVVCVCCDRLLECDSRSPLLREALKKQSFLGFTYLSKSLILEAVDCRPEITINTAKNLSWFCFYFRVLLISLEDVWLLVSQKSPRSKILKMFTKISFKSLGELTDYLSLRGLSVTGKKRELVATAFSACEQNVGAVVNDEELRSRLAIEYKHRN